MNHPLDSRHDGKWVFGFVEKATPTETPAAEHPIRPVASMHSNESIRVSVEVVDKATGEREDRRFRIRKSIVSILTYGKLVEFSRTNMNGVTFRDGRDGKTKPLGFAKLELRRMLGVTEGDKEFAKLSLV